MRFNKRGVSNILVASCLNVNRNLSFAAGGFLAVETNGGPQAHGLAAELRIMRGSIGSAVYEYVAVVGDSFGVERFVTASRAWPPTLN